jgi:hypothetical protein
MAPTARPIKLGYEFVDFPAHPPEHQGTGSISYSPILIHPSSVAQPVNIPLTFQPTNCNIKVMCLTIPGGAAPNWFGIAYRAGISSFSSVNVFCHPSPANAGMTDAAYEARSGNWPLLFRYAQNLGFQLDAANCNQVLIVPFFNNASYGTAGIFGKNWKEIAFVALNVARRASKSIRTPSSVDQTLVSEWGDPAQNVEVDRVVLSCFSYGRHLMYTIRSVAVDLESHLSEIWDFNGVGPPPPSSSVKVRAMVYDQEVSNDRSAFHVPPQRWASPTFPGTPPKSYPEVHGHIPNMLMWHAASLSGVGK